MQEFKYARIEDWSMQVWKDVGMQLCKYARMQEYYLLLSIFDLLYATCYITEFFYLKLAITCKNFFLSLVVVKKVL